MTQPELPKYERTAFILELDQLIKQITKTQETQS